MVSTAGPPTGSDAYGGHAFRVAPGAFQFSEQSVQFGWSNRVTNDLLVVTQQVSLVLRRVN